MNRQQKTDVLLDFFDACQESGISLESKEFKQISTFAVKDAFINYAGDNINSLVDLDVESLSDRNVAIIIKRARTALKRILEMKKKYIAGPFNTSRHFRRAQSKLNRSKRTTAARNKASIVL